jgi:glyoxylase-like metal-dependent hydrolase (beta-lactamase superfamily II)
MTVHDWTAPGCHQVAAGVYRVPLPLPMDGLRAVNVYVLTGGDGIALIDAGWAVPGAVEQLAAALREIGYGLADIRDIYVTHIHRDHYTLGPELRRRIGARVHLGAAEEPGVVAINELASNVPASSIDQLRRAGASDLVGIMEQSTAEEPWRACDWEPADHWLKPGPILVGGRTLEAVATPGHTKGHLVFHDVEGGLVFTGDHVLPGITPSIGFELGEWELPLGRYLDSLRLLLDRPDAWLLPAHGDVADSVHKRVEELLTHHDRRLDQTTTALSSDEPSTGLEVAARLTWTRRERPFETLDDFNQMIAVCEALAHLDLLVSTGRLRRTIVRGVDRFVSR